MDRVSLDVERIVDAALAGTPPTTADCERLCEVATFSADYYALLLANERLSREASHGIAEVHAQIGIDANPCSKNCLFCSFAACNTQRRGNVELSLEQILAYAEAYRAEASNCLTVMITADYDLDRYFSILTAIHQAMPELPIMANMGDFVGDEGACLRQAGVNSIFHSIRMGEGVINAIPLAARIKTIEAAHAAGLKVATCVEMISPSYSPKEIVEKIELSISLQPESGMVGTQVAVPGTKMEHAPRYSGARAKLYAAIYRMKAGTGMRFSNKNLTWAEVGVNPRDNEAATEASGLGRDVMQVRHELEEDEWTVRFGASDFW